MGRTVQRATHPNTRRHLQRLHIQAGTARLRTARELDMRTAALSMLAPSRHRALLAGSILGILLGVGCHIAAASAEEVHFKLEFGWQGTIEAPICPLGDYPMFVVKYLDGSGKPLSADAHVLDVKQPNGTCRYEAQGLVNNGPTRLIATDGTYVFSCTLDIADKPIPGYISVNFVTQGCTTN